MKYQQAVYLWAVECFGGAVAKDRVERVHRFLEEALELGQSLGLTRADAMRLVHYVFSRPVGEPAQEVGGTMVTLAVLCEACDLDMDGEAKRELQRITAADVIERIRKKQATKPHGSPLPGTDPQVLSGCAVRAGLQREAVAELERIPLDDSQHP